eukprot:s6620_g1.t2
MEWGEFYSGPTIDLRVFTHEGQDYAVLDDVRHSHSQEEFLQIPAGWEVARFEDADDAHELITHHEGFNCNLLVTQDAVFRSSRAAQWREEDQGTKCNVFAPDFCKARSRTVTSWFGTGGTGRPCSRTTRGYRVSGLASCCNGRVWFFSWTSDAQTLRWMWRFSLWLAIAWASLSWSLLPPFVICGKWWAARTRGIGTPSTFYREECWCVRMTKSCPDFNVIPKPRTLKPEPMQSQYQRRKSCSFRPRWPKLCTDSQTTRAELNESGIKEKCKNFGPLM